MSKPKTKFTKPSRTQPQFARDLDMNVVVKKYARGVMPPLRGGGQYLDNTVLPQDYQQAMDIVIRAQGAFDRLPRYRDWETDRKSTRLNSSHSAKSRMPSSA